MTDLGSYGAWVTTYAFDVPPALAVEIERLGYRTLWVGNASGDLRLIEGLLDAASTLTVATGIVDIWSNRSSARRSRGVHPYLVTPAQPRQPRRRRKRSSPHTWTPAPTTWRSN